MLRAVADQAGLNLVVDEAVEGRVTVNLANLPAVDALVFLAEKKESTTSEIVYL